MSTPVQCYPVQILDVAKVLTRGAERLRSAIVDLMRSRGLSQEAVGRLFGIKQSYVNLLLQRERGDKGVSEAVVRAAYESLHLDPLYFIEDWPDSEPPKSWEDYKLDRRDDVASLRRELDDVRRMVRKLHTAQECEDHGSGVRRR